MRRECLNRFAYFGLRHFDHIVQTYANYYIPVRPHQGKDNQPLTANVAPIPIRAADSPPRPEKIGPVQRHTWLGELLSHYERCPTF